MMSYSGGGDMSRPSFFEVAAADRLIQGLRPAMQHILVTLSNHLPQLNVLANRGDEIFFGMCFLLDRHYLETKGASFAENFYCLKRVKMLPDGKQTPLSPRDKFLAVLCLAGVPYLRTKLEAYYNELKQDMADMAVLGVSNDGPLMSAFKNFYVTFYPYAAFAYEGLEYIHAFRYIIGSIDNFSPLTSLLSQKVQRLSFQDMLASRIRKAKESVSQLPAVDEPMESAWRVQQSRRVGILRRFVSMLSRVGGLVADNAKWAVYIGVFFIRFLQWWYSPENQQNNVRPTIAPPPPPRAIPHPEGVEIPVDKAKCPLCLRNRVNSAMLPSGFVFCYTCIFNHLKDEGTCPVTLRPCRMEDLRKIYES